MTQQLRDLYATLDQVTRRRLKWAIVGLVAISGFEMLGLVLMLPLMQMFAGASIHVGTLGRIDEALGSPSRGALAAILAGVVFGAFVVKGISTLSFRWWMIGFLNIQAAETADQLVGRYLTAPYELHLRRNSADLVRTSLNAVNDAYMKSVMGVLTVVAEGTTILAVAVVLLVLRPLPALAAVFYFFFVSYGFLRYVRRRAQRASADLVDSSMGTYQAAFQGLGGIKEVQVRRRASHFMGKFSAARLVYARATRMALFLGEAPRYVMEMLFIVGLAVMSIVVFSSSDSTQAAATLGLFVAAGFRMMPSMVRLLAAVNNMRVGEKAVELVVRDLQALEPPPASGSEHPPVVLERGITVERVSFAFESSTSPVLDEVSIQLDVGRSLAIVGSSGAGKTTLVDIILGLHDPSSGRVLVDGLDIAGIKDSWQRAIGLVPQDVFLLDDSLRCNIAFGEHESEIDEQRLTESIQRAQLEDLVASMPEGDRTFVGERGVRISGGQRQRIGIARALYLRPQLLVLDEATSSLDSMTERQITDTIESLRGEQTMIVVAHRLSTVRRCDMLIFMEHGRITSTGTFDEVKRASPKFAQLVSLGSLDATVEG